MKMWMGVCAALSLLAGAVGVAGAQAPDPKLVAEGKKVFTAVKCNMCHGVEGKGNQKLTLDGVGKKLSPADIRKWITSPAEMTATLEKKPVVPMKKVELKDAEVDALVAYLRSLK